MIDYMLKKITYNPRTILTEVDADWDNALPLPHMLNDIWVNRPSEFIKTYYDVVFDDGFKMFGVFVADDCFGDYPTERVIRCRFSIERNMDWDFFVPRIKIETK